jgi:hypothetical protein
MNIAPVKFQAQPAVSDLTAQPRPVLSSADVVSLSAKDKPTVLKGLKVATPRLVDALGLFLWSNLLVGPGHVFMLPIAVADGAVAVNEFRKAAGLKPLAENQAAESFIAKAKASLDLAKINAAGWEKPFKSLYKLGLATTAAGILIHPLLFVGVAMMALPNLARDVGITVNVFKQLLSQGQGMAKK